MNIKLRPLVLADAEWLDAWLPQIAEKVGDERTTASSFLDWSDVRDKQVAVIQRDTNDVGIAAWSLLSTEAAAVIELVAVAPRYARAGSGMAAAALLEREVSAAGVRTAFAPASERHGISMYFWIRLGYAPILQAAWPCHRPGVAWLRRTLP